MDSRYGAFNIPRRPVTSAADPPPPYSALPDRPPLPPRLRASKSVAQLHERPVQHPDRPPPLPLSKDKSATTLPPGFMFQEGTSPLLPDSAPPIRRAKSSVDLRRPQTALPQPQDSSWKKALDEAQYLASGLLSSPAESTRHHTIIRHSSALVWYRGPATAVTLSVLADAPLPPARTLWLQQKGFSGSIGMSVKALVGTKNDWLDVTPARRAEVADLPVNEERGIQRDWKRFASKATGRTRGHCPRETLVVRIPAAAQDGYFRVVLCGEPGKVLVGSPVFRLASTSADVSVLRGAGLRTMPLEMGVKMASAVASTYVTAATGAAAGAAKMGAGKVAAKVTNTAVRRVAKQAYRGAVGDAVKESWSTSTAARYERAVSSAMMQPTVGVLGGADGPEAPFPLNLAGRVVRGTGYTRARYGFPTANVAGTSEERTMRMAGYFAAWARVLPGEDWCEAVVRIGPAENAPPSIISKNAVAVHILQDMDDVELCDAALQVLVMGFLRPLADVHVDVAMQQHADDLLTTLATLAREDWQPRTTMERVRAVKSARSWGERLDGVTGMVARSVDRVPMHKAGIRSEAGMLRNEGFGNGGLWIQR